MANKMKSLQYVPREKSLQVVECESPSSPEFPCLYIDSLQMPEIDEWEVGKEYEVTFTVKMKSYSISDDGDGRSSAQLSMEAYDGKSEKSLD